MHVSFGGLWISWRRSSSGLWFLVDQRLSTGRLCIFYASGCHRCHCCRACSAKATVLDSLCKHVLSIYLAPAPNGWVEAPVKVDDLTVDCKWLDCDLRTHQQHQQQHRRFGRTSRRGQVDMLMQIDSVEYGSRTLSDIFDDPR